MLAPVKQFTRQAYREIRNLSVRPREATYFVIVAQERTGSTLLSDLLSFHPDVLMDRHNFYTPKAWSQSSGTAESLYSSAPIRGFKLKVTETPRQDDPKRVRRWFREHDENIQWVRLRRRNTLRQAVSAHIADRRDRLHSWQKEKLGTITQLWKERDADASADDESCTVRPRAVVEKVQYFEILDQFEDRVLQDVSPLTLTYETDLLPQAQHERTAHRVFDHLGLSEAPVETRLEKVTPPALNTLVDNYDKLVDAVERENMESRL
jgi:LPS sulfotransferase NodH